MKRILFCFDQSFFFFQESEVPLGLIRIWDDFCHYQLYINSHLYQCHWLRQVPVLYLHLASCCDCTVYEGFLRRLEFLNTYWWCVGGASCRAGVFALVSPCFLPVRNKTVRNITTLAAPFHTKSFRSSLEHCCVHPLFKQTNEKKKERKTQQPRAVWKCQVNEDLFSQAKQSWLREFHLIWFISN